MHPTGRINPIGTSNSRGSAPFTTFVLHQRGSRTPDPVLFHDAWNSLQAALGAELKRRGLWQLPPGYLGVYGYERWGAEQTVGDPMSQAWGRTRAPQSALGELVADCWDFIFSSRMGALKLHLAAKGNIDGLVLRNVKNFVHDRQREHDPVGFRLFEQVKGVLGDAVARRTLHVLAGDRRIRNNTVLGFAPATSFRLPALDLAPIVASWNDELLPGLITARGRIEAATRARLEQLVLDLPRHGVSCFRFRDLLGPLKHDARLRWADLLARDEAAGPIADSPEPEEPARAILPELRFESRARFAHLTRFVSAAIPHVAGDPRLRGQLATLWSFLLQRHRERDATATGPRDAPRGDTTTESPLSHRQLASRLHIPRERLPLLFATLQELVRQSRETGRVPPRGRRAPSGLSAPGAPRGSS